MFAAFVVLGAISGMTALWFIVYVVALAILEADSNG